MKRDMDLVRQLLMETDESPELDGNHWLPAENITIDGYSPEQIYYHLNLLIEAGFVTGQTAMPAPVISKLTWNGHEFLDDIRDPDIWSKTKEHVQAFGSLGVALVWEIAKSEIKKKLGL